MAEEGKNNRLPAVGEEGGERKAVDEPARTAE